MKVNRPLVYNLASAGASMLMTLLLLRGLTASQYGSYALITSALFLTLAVGGLKTGELLLKTPLDYTSSTNIVNKLLIMDCRIHIILFLIAAPISIWYATVVGVDLLLMGAFQFLILINIGYSINENLFVVKKKIELFYLAKTVHSLLALVVCTFFAANQNLMGVLFSFIFLTFARNIFYFFSLNKVEPGIFAVNSKSNYELGNSFAFFKYNYISSSLKSSTEGLDIIMLSFLVTKEQAGIYQAAKKLASIPSVYFGSFWASKSNMIYEHVINKFYHQIRKSIVKTYKQYLSIWILISIAIFLGYENITGHLFPGDAAEAGLVFCIFFAAFYLEGLFAGYGRVLFLSLDKPRFLVTLNLLTFVTVLVGFPLISVFDNQIFLFAMAILLVSLVRTIWVNYEIFAKKYKQVV